MGGVQTSVLDLPIQKPPAKQAAEHLFADQVRELIAQYQDVRRRLITSVDFNLAPDSGVITHQDIDNLKTKKNDIFLSETLHPSIGYLYAWVSLTVGFSAPIAIAAMAMNNYLNPIIRAGIYPGLAFLLFIPLTHIFSIKRSSQFQNLFTLIKILFILGLIGIGWTMK